MTVAFRVDASAAIGVGHLKRCLALAAALRTLDQRSVFVVRDSGSPALALVEAEGHGLLRLPAAGGDDAALSVAALQGQGCRRVVVDHYGLAADWHRALRQALGAPVAAIDDLADRDLDVDLLVDHNLAADHRAKYGRRLPPQARLLGGPRHALLGPAYATAPRAAPQDPVRSVGVFLGGTDPGGHSAVVVQALRQLSGFRGAIEVVTTSANPRHTELAAALAQWPGTTLALDLPDLAAFFARHGLQVGAGGGASWERCCIGAPSLLLELADNQRAVIPQLVALGAAAALPPGTPPEAAAIAAALRPLLADAALRQRLAASAQALVDGHGALRVAAALCAAQLQLRPATADDRALMFGWRNDPRTRAVSRQQQPIAEDEHARWLAATLARSDRLLLVGQIGRCPVGVIRFDRLADGPGDAQAEVSLYLDPRLTGLGLGPRLLAAGEAAAAAHFGAGLQCVATVLDGNASSAQLFRQAGYVQSGELWRKAPAAVPPTSLESPA